MSTRTFFSDGKHEIELKDWDAFVQWCKDVQKYFEDVTEYAGYPNLPEFWMEGQKIHDRASEREKSMIAGYAMSCFMHALQHWRSDQDTLFDPKKREEFLQRIAPLEKLLKKHHPLLHFS